MWYFGEMKGKNLKPKSMNEIKNKYGSQIMKKKEKVRLSN